MLSSARPRSPAPAPPASRARSATGRRARARAAARAPRRRSRGWAATPRMRITSLPSIARSVTFSAASSAATAAMRRAQLAQLALGILAEAAARDVALAQREQIVQRLVPADAPDEAADRAVGPVGRVEEHVVLRPSPTTRSRSALASFSRRQIASAISAPTYSCLKKLYSPGAPSRGWRARGLPTSCSSAPSRRIGVALRRVHDAPACARRRRACETGSACSRRPRAAPGSPRRAGPSRASARGRATAAAPPAS